MRCITYTLLSKPYRRPHRWITSAFQVSTAGVHFLVNSIGREFCSCLVLKRKGRKAIKILGRAEPTVDEACWIYDSDQIEVSVLYSTFF